METEDIYKILMCEFLRTLRYMVKENERCWAVQLIQIVTLSLVFEGVDTKYWSCQNSLNNVV